MNPMSTGNVILEVAERYGAERNKEETARKMLAKNMDILDIIEITGLSPERIREIRNTLRDEAV